MPATCSEHLGLAQPCIVCAAIKRGPVGTLGPPSGPGQDALAYMRGVCDALDMAGVTGAIDGWEYEADNGQRFPVEPVIVEGEWTVGGAAVEPEPRDPLETLSLSPRAEGMLVSAGFSSVAELLGVWDVELLRRGLGPDAIGEVREALTRRAIRDVAAMFPDNEGLSRTATQLQYMRPEALDETSRTFGYYVVTSMDPADRERAFVVIAGAHPAWGVLLRQTAKRHDGATK